MAESFQLDHIHGLWIVLVHPPRICRVARSRARLTAAFRPTGGFDAMVTVEMTTQCGDARNANCGGSTDGPHGIQPWALFLLHERQWTRDC